MNWNCINGFGGKMIAEAATRNTTLKFLDIASNSMGIGDKDCSPAWAGLLAKQSQSALIHLDISYNRFDSSQSGIIQAELRQNWKILGFHFKGNCGEMAVNGHLCNTTKKKVHQQDFQLELEPEEQCISPTVTNITCPSLILLHLPSQKATRGRFGAMENCWICEGWAEKEFIWKPTFSGPVSSPPIFIHFEFDGWSPHQMNLSKVSQQQQADPQADGISSEEVKQFTYKQMVPPNQKMLYFFTAAGNQLHAKDQPWTIKQMSIQIPFADTAKDCHLTKMNFIFTTQGTPTMIYDAQYQVIISSKARKQEAEVYMPVQQELSFTWTLGSSQFEVTTKDKRKETFPSCVMHPPPELNRSSDCFEFDWRHVQLHRVVRETDQIEKLRVFFKQNYPSMIALYKYYASFFPSGEVWCWNQQTYQMFVSETGIVDGRYFPMKNSLLCFIQTNNLAETKTHPQEYTETQLILNPENCIVRYELIELLTVIGQEKFLKPGLCKSLSESVETLYKQSIEQLADGGRLPDAQEWREQRLFNEKCDNYFRLYNQLLQKLFNRYAKRREPKDVVGLFDFRNFLAEFKITEVSEREANFMFSQCVQLQVDELSKFSHLFISFSGFLELIVSGIVMGDDEDDRVFDQGRLADQLSMTPFMQENDLFWTKEKCVRLLPLHVKVEALIMRLLRCNVNNVRLSSEFHYQDVSLFLEEMQSIKHGKEILEKTRRIIQTKVVGTMAMIRSLKKNSRKDQEKRNYSLGARNILSDKSIGAGGEKKGTGGGAGGGAGGGEGPPKLPSISRIVAEPQSSHLLPSIKKEDLQRKESSSISTAVKELDGSVPRSRSIHSQQIMPKGETAAAQVEVKEEEVTSQPSRNLLGWGEMNGAAGLLGRRKSSKDQSLRQPQIEMASAQPPPPSQSEQKKMMMSRYITPISSSSQTKLSSKSLKVNSSMSSIGLSSVKRKTNEKVSPREIQRRKDNEEGQGKWSSSRDDQLSSSSSPQPQEELKPHRKSIQISKFSAAQAQKNNANA